MESQNTYAESRYFLIMKTLRWLSCIWMKIVQVYRLWTVVRHHKLQWWSHNPTILESSHLDRDYSTCIASFKRPYKLSSKHSGFFSLLCVRKGKSRIHNTTYTLYLLISLLWRRFILIRKYPYTKLRSIPQCSHRRLNNILCHTKIFSLYWKQ